jgi:hypothetical protein
MTKVIKNINKIELEENSESRELSGFKFPFNQKTEEKKENENVETLETNKINDSFIRNKKSVDSNTINEDFNKLVKKFNIQTNEEENPFKFTNFDQNRRKNSNFRSDDDENPDLNKRKNSYFQNDNLDLNKRKNSIFQTENLDETVPKYSSVDLNRRKNSISGLLFKIDNEKVDFKKKKMSIHDILN